MTRFLELLISVVIVVVLFVLVAVFLPDRRTMQNSADTSHPLRQVFDTVNSFKHFADWNPLRQHDSRVKYQVSGPDVGVGARLDYSSTRKEIGAGSWHITDSQQDDQVRYTVYNDAYGQNKNHLLTMTRHGKIVEIDWTYSVDYGWSLPGRYAGLYVDRTVGDDIKRSLANLTNLLASMPNFDYSNLDVQVRAVAPRNMLYVTTTADRNFTAIENATILALKDIRAAIKKNDLVEAGRPRVITTNYGAEKYEFDVAIPVARLGEQPDEMDDVDDVDDVDDASEASVDEAESVAADPFVALDEDASLTPPAPLEGLTLSDNVHAGQSYGGRVAMAPYRGHPAALPLIRDQLRSYAVTFGEELQDRSFEEYLTEIEDTAAEDASFRVFWPIK